MKKTILLGLLTTTLLFNAGCDSGDLAAGLIGVGVGIGIGAAVNEHDHHHHHRPPPRYRRDRHRHRHWDMSPETMALDTQAQNFAAKHQISFEAAVKIQDTFAAAETEGLGAFSAIGMNEQGIRSLMQKEVPDAATLATVGEKLELSSTQAGALLQSLIQEFSAQAANIESPYWKSCLAKGKWKTPENQYCTKAFWNGCSPQTGASMCY